ncbi:MAG: PAS domain-containing protein [Janthinobacterium lividum]
MSKISSSLTFSDGPGLGADQLLDTLPWGLLVLSPAGVVRRLNQQAAAWWGLPVTAVLGQALGQVGPGQLPAAAYAALLQAASRSSVMADCYLLQTEQ